MKLWIISAHILGSITSSYSTNYATYESKCWQPWFRQSGEPQREHMLASLHFSNGLLSQCGNITYYSLHNISGGKSQSMSHKWSSICNRLFINMLMPISAVSHNIVFTSWMVPIKWLLNFGDSSQQLSSRSETKYSAKNNAYTYEHYMKPFSSVSNQCSIQSDSCGPPWC